MGFRWRNREGGIKEKTTRGEKVGMGLNLVYGSSLWRFFRLYLCISIITR
jgi:hypothetical protein